MPQSLRNSDSHRLAETERKEIKSVNKHEEIETTSYLSDVNPKLNEGSFARLLVTCKRMLKTKEKMPPLLDRCVQRMFFMQRTLNMSIESSTTPRRGPARQNTHNPSKVAAEARGGDPRPP
ncbi:unnamed protein product [Ixodes persulcatus]